MTTDTKAVTRWDVQDMPNGMEHIRCAKYADLLDYHYGVSGEGPHAYTWSDKPHRLVYDLTAEVAELRDEITDHERVVGELESKIVTGGAISGAAMGQITKLAIERDTLRAALAASRAEAEGLKLVANHARNLAAWFTSGNSIPVDGVHMMKLSSHTVMDDARQLREALAAMEKGNV